MTQERERAEEEDSGNGNDPGEGEGEGERNTEEREGRRRNVVDSAQGGKGGEEQKASGQHPYAQEEG
jgi:hypothetical protein